MRPPIMSHSGRESPVKAANTRSTHPGEESPVKGAAKFQRVATSPVKEAAKITRPATSPKFTFRVPNARRRKKRAATPHPVKIGGNSKREALSSLPETGRARKKIVFENEDPAAGNHGGSHATSGDGMENSPSGDCEGGRRPRQARPGPFEAVAPSIARLEVETGSLNLRGYRHGGN